MHSVEFAPTQEIVHSLPPHGVSAQFLCTMYRPFGIEVTHSLQQFTYGVCDFSRIVDDVIDFPNREIPESFDDLLGQLENDTIPDMSPLEAGRALRYAESLDSDQLDFARQKYLEAVEVAELRSKAHSMPRYSHAISREAEVQSAVLSLDEGLERNDLEGRRKYNQWLGHFMLAGYYVDSVFDLRKDYQEGRVQVAPSSLNRSRLLVHSIKPLSKAVRLMPPQIVPALGLLLPNFIVPALKRRFD